MRSKDSLIFEKMYFAEMQADPYAKKYYCYLRAEGQYIRDNGQRKYKNWQTFRKVLSVRARKRRLNILV